MIEFELNARPLEYREVGKKFVVHPEFHKLISTNNSLVVGPRGSGKTTMLKVLTPEAQKAWNPKTSEEKVIKDSITFLGLYVPLSRIFQDDLESRYANSKLLKDQKDNLLFKIYFLNIVESVVELVFFLVTERGYDKKQEADTAEIIRKTLNIELPYCYKISSLLRGVSELKLGARRQLNSSKYIETIIYSGEILNSVEPLLKTINEIFDLNPNQKYALCLDELDVYASAFTTEMVKNLRGGSTNIILKLTLAPIHDITISQFIDPPQLIHDYDRIYLWPTTIENDKMGKEKKYLDFSEELACQTIYEITKKEVNLDDLLGDFSYLEVFENLKKSETDNTIYKKINTNTEKDLEISAFQQLANLQPNFKRFLNSFDIDVNNFNIVGRKTSSTTLRKLKEIVLNRLITTTTENGKPRYRASKVMYQYHGKKMVLKALDGNPRYLKKLMEYLTEHLKVKDEIVSRIPIADQSRCLEKIKNLLMQRIEAIPVDSKDSRLSAGILVEQIGEYISNKLNLETEWKSTNFPSYIKVPNIREIKGYEDTFRKAINNGALMIIGEIDLTKLNTVKLKELRLNYLLHLEYAIPIRKYYPVSFENVLKIKPSQSNTLFNDI